MSVYRFSGICDKYQNLMSWPECVFYIFILNLPIQRIGEYKINLNPNTLEVTYGHMPSPLEMNALFLIQGLIILE